VIRLRHPIIIELRFTHYRYGLTGKFRNSLQINKVGFSDHTESGHVPAGSIFAEQASHGKGYSSHGAASEKYQKSDERATMVRQYLMEHFQLQPQKTGSMPLSGSPPEKTGKESWDGISLVVLT
jgi:hypothetical protein